jgi:CheY-like chemotaxis protein
MPEATLHVLVAEDEVLLRLMLADELREQGFQVFEAVHAEEAISILQAVRVDAVITDLHMRTAGDGVVVANYVRAKRPGVPVILTSMQAPPTSDHSPFDAFFVKPLKPEDIGAWIKRHHATTTPREGSGVA